MGSIDFSKLIEFIKAIINVLKELASKIAEVLGITTKAA